jgi:REP element-mobilizing transposase RayT
MNRGLHRQPIFENDLDRRRMLSLLGDIDERYGVQTHAFALMANHYHLLLYAPYGGLSKAMRHLNGTYAQSYNRLHDLDGPLFRGRFKSLTVENDEYFVELVRYIHRNPVEAGMCDFASEYPWSSQRSYAALAPAPKFLHQSKTLEYFGFDRRRFVAFVDAPDSAAARSVIEAIDSGQPALGDADFIRRVKASARLDIETRASARRLPGIRRIDALEAWVCDAMGTAVTDLADHGGGRRNDALSLLVTIAHRSGMASLAELAERYGYANYYGVSSQIRRFEARSARDPRLRQLLERGLAIQQAA